MGNWKELTKISPLFFWKACLFICSRPALIPSIIQRLCSDHLGRFQIPTKGTWCVTNGACTTQSEVAHPSPSLGGL